MTRIKDYAITHPLSTGYVANINRRIVFNENETNPTPIGAKVTLTFTANPAVVRYKEARAIARAIGGTAVQV